MYGLNNGWFGNIKLPFSINSNSSSGNGSIVTKQLEFTLTDQYSGSALASKTLYLYSGGGTPVLLETLTATDASGITHSAKAYPSGTALSVEYISGNTKEWYSVTVPTPSSADANSNEYNIISLNSFTYPASFSYSLAVSSQNATENYTCSTMNNNRAPIFVYQVTNTGADNTGIADSNSPDPIYGDQWGTWLVVSITGAGYETIIPSGFDQIFSIGQTTYGVIHLNNQMLTKWKVGNTYELGYSGGQTLSFSLDLTGYSVNTATMTVAAYAYCDPSYALTHGGNFGGAKVLLCTDTDSDNVVTLDGT